MKKIKKLIILRSGLNMNENRKKDSPFSIHLFWNSESKQINHEQSYFTLLRLSCASI